MLKLCLTDGAQVVCGIERRPILSLRNARPGAKLVMGNRPLLRRGLLLLEPQHLEVFGAALPPAAATPSTTTAPSSAPPAVLPPFAHDHTTTHLLSAAPPAAATGPLLAANSTTLPGSFPPPVQTRVELPCTSSPPGVGLSNTGHAMATPGPPAANQLGVPSQATVHVPMQAPNMPATSSTTSAPQVGRELLQQPAALYIPGASAPAPTPPWHLPGAFPPVPAAAELLTESPCRPPKPGAWTTPSTDDEVTSRFYVAKADLREGGSSLLLRLCDGEAHSEAVLAPPLLQSVLGDVPTPKWKAKALCLHGHFELKRRQGAEGVWDVISFSRSPLQSDVEAFQRLLQRL